MAGVNLTMSDGSVRGAIRTTPISLAALAKQLQQQSRTASATAWGTPGPRLRSVLPALQRLGVIAIAPGVQQANQPLPMLLVLADGRDAAAAHGVMFIAVEGDGTTPLLLPAVQCAREAARRIQKSGGHIDLVLVQAPDAASQRAPSEQMALNFQAIRD